MGDGQRGKTCVASGDRRPGTYVFFPCCWRLAFFTWENGTGCLPAEKAEKAAGGGLDDGADFFGVLFLDSVYVPSGERGTGSKGTVLPVVMDTGRDLFCDSFIGRILPASWKIQAGKNGRRI